MRATGWYLQDTEDFGLGMPDEQPKATEMVPQIVAAIEELIRRGYAYEVDGDVYYRVSRFEEYGRLSGQRPEQVEEQEPNPRKEDARDFALWKANKPGEDTSWESPWGRGRPGWHIECSVMAEELLGSVFEIHGGGLDLVFPHHENEIAQSRALGHPFAQLWMHNGMLRFVGEKMSKSSGKVETIRNAHERWGRETLLVFFLTAHWSKPIDYSDETLTAADARKERLREVFRNPSEPAAGGRMGTVRCGTRRRLQHARGAGDHALLARPRLAAARARHLRAGVAGGGRGSAGRRAGACRAASVRARERRLRRERPAARRDRRRRLGRPRRRRRLSARPEAVTRDQVYGRRAVREALRGRRQVLELWATERALAGEPWLGESAVKVHVHPDRELTDAVGTRDHQGVIAWTEPYRYADGWELAAVDRPLLVCLDRVTDPRNLGAVCRSAEGAGATGVVVPAHGSAVITPAVAKASAGAVEHLPVAVVPNLARYLAEIKGLISGSTPRRATVDRRSGRRTSPAGRCWSSAPKGRACARSSAGRVTRRSRFRSRARSSR